ncbi:60S ribosomal protein L30 [Drosophila persimilis]|nr:60S ribosomal protein L30 [Drosophila persimilis]
MWQASAERKIMEYLRKRPETSTDMEKEISSVGNKKKFICNKSIQENIRMTVKVNCDEVFCSHSCMMKAIREQKAKVVIVATKTPPSQKAEIEHYAKVAKCQIIYYGGRFIECANSCGKVFLFCTVAISTQKDAAIIRSLSEKLVAGIALFLDGKDVTN